LEIPQIRRKVTGGNENPGAEVTPMRNLADYPRMSGESEGGIRIGDCYVWAEIYYLDSPTDYRENLAQHCARQCPVADDLVMLDSSVFSRISRARHLRLWPMVLLGALIFWFLMSFVSVW
jgi:hypothetical protein